MKEAVKRARRDTWEALKPHSDYVIWAHESYGDMRNRLLGVADTASGEKSKSASRGETNGAEKEGKVVSRDEGAWD